MILREERHSVITLFTPDPGIVTAWIAISDIITFLESFEYPIAAVGIQIVNYPLLSLDRS